MKKIISFFRKAAGWLASFGGDRWLHFIAGLLIAFFVGCIADGVAWQAGLVGVLVAFVIGFVKEVADSFTGSPGDLMDLLFTTLGAAAGYGLLVAAWAWA